MKRLFVRTLATILAALLVLVAVMAVVAVLGFRRSLDQWVQTRQRQLEEAAREILRLHPGPQSIDMPEDLPFFVYDANKQLIFSNRGEPGRRRGALEAGAHGELIPLLEDGVLQGYYRSGGMQFQNDAANSRFLHSIHSTVWLGLCLAMGISVPLALLFSRSLTRPAAGLARGLDLIARGDLSARIPEKGAEEIALIARSANRLAKRLQREQDIRRQWVQDIAHDLRTPIAAMKAQFEGMRDGVLDISTARLEKSLTELNRIEKLVTDLEELMRLESPELRVAIRKIDAPAFVEELQERFAHELERRQIRFEHNLGVQHFEADPALLQRAVTNLFANALRHTPAGGKIVLSVEPAGEGTTLLSLANTGNSIPPEELEKLFDRLYRGEYSRNSPGSGLGLTITRRIAELHGGTAVIRNWEQGGVVAQMTLRPSSCGS